MSTPTEHPDLAAGLRARRKRAGLTQQQLAQLADVSASMVAFLERGYRPSRGSVALDRIERVLAALAPKTSEGPATNGTSAKLGDAGADDVAA